MLSDLLLECWVLMGACVCENVVVMFSELVRNFLWCCVCVIVDFECWLKMLFWMCEVFDCWPEAVVSWALFNDINFLFVHVVFYLLDAFVYFFVEVIYLFSEVVCVVLFLFLPEMSA